MSNDGSKLVIMHHTVDDNLRFEQFEVTVPSKEIRPLKIGAQIVRHWFANCHTLRSRRIQFYKKTKHIEIAAKNMHPFDKMKTIGTV